MRLWHSPAGVLRRAVAVTFLALASHAWEVAQKMWPPDWWDSASESGAWMFLALALHAWAVAQKTWQAGWWDLAAASEAAWICQVLVAQA